MPTTTLLPNVDVTTDWETANPGPDHFEDINEDVDGGSVNDTNYIETTIIDSEDEFELTDTPANCSQVTQVVVAVRGQIDDASATARLMVKLEHSGGTDVAPAQYVTGANLGGYGNLGEHELTFPGLTLTKAQADSMQVRVTFQESA